MKTGIILALAIAVASGAASAQALKGAPREADPRAGLPASGVISTEAEAKARLEGQGYRAVGQLVRGTDGQWHGTAIRNAASLAVTVDAKGAIATR